MADPNAPRAVFVRQGGAWKMVDGIDVGASAVNVAGTWRNLTEMHVKVGGVWYQVFSNTAPGATTISTRAFATSSIEISWTNPSGVWQQRIQRAEFGGAFSDIVAQSGTIRTSYSDTSVDATTAGTVGTSMTNPVQGSTTNVQGKRWVYRIINYDFYGHSSQLDIDMLRGRVPSPLFVRPTDSATWRGTGGFRTDSLAASTTDGSFTRLFQGYTGSTTGLNYGTCWYGGTGNGIVNNCFSNTLLPSVTAAGVMLCRDGGGNSGDAKATTWMHTQLSKGSTNAWSNNATNTAGNLYAREEEVNSSIGTTNGAAWVAGTYKGFVIYDSSTTLESYGTSANYIIGYAPNEPQSGQYAGTLELTHSG